MWRLEAGSRSRKHVYGLQNCSTIESGLSAVVAEITGAKILVAAAADLLVTNVMWAELGSAATLLEKWWRRCLVQPLKVNGLELDTEDRWFIWHRRPLPRVMGGGRSGGREREEEVDCEGNVLVLRSVSVLNETKVCFSVL